MPAKKQKKSSIKPRRTQPFLTHTWVLVLYLLLFILIIIFISEKGKIQTLLPSSTAPNNPTSQKFNLTQYREAAVNELKITGTSGDTLPKIISAEEVDWPDTSLGCPQKGMMYAQVITPGYKIHMELNGKEYIYHAGLNHVILCDR